MMKMYDMGKTWKDKWKRNWIENEHRTGRS